MSTEKDSCRIVVSVRRMVEFICRGGDLENGEGFSPSRALEGTQIHQKLQEKRSDTYRKEVPLFLDIDCDDFVLRVEGRADGIDQDQIEEIKSTYAPASRLQFSFNPCHRAQLLVYGAIYAQREKLETVSLRLTYYQMKEETEYSFDEEWKSEELQNFLDRTAASYAKWVRYELEHQKARTKALQKLIFPYDSYRPGQRDMAGIVYRTIRDGSQVLLQAPTGIGKTISTLFPALKAMGEGITDRLFYLTAKNATSQAASDALVRIDEQQKEIGPYISSVLLCAREKICAHVERGCDSAHCDRAMGHYDRINEALWTLLHETGRWDRNAVLDAAERHRVCPYALLFEAASWADVIIGDYNYALDPTASLKRFFGEDKTDYTLLIDEAHNLPDRGRDMFSARLDTQSLQAALRAVHVRRREEDPSVSARARLLRKSLRELMNTLDSLAEKDFQILSSLPEKVAETLYRLNAQLGEYLEANAAAESEDVRQLYFSTLFFARIAEELDESYAILAGREEEEESYLRLFCIHPASQLQKRYAKVKAVIHFSATMLPIRYYQELLSRRDADGPMTAYALSGAFSPSQKKILCVRDLRLDYRSRDRYTSCVADVIFQTYMARPGRYIAFFPSYVYLRQVLAEFEKQHPAIVCWPQKSGGQEEDRREWLSHFQDGEEKGIGFAVLGGMFSEGIDLVGDKLIGTIIATVGMPQIGAERDLIRDRMQQLCGDGFDYAYRYPGLNKVFQAGGRVIRTETDRGVIVLIDSRFLEIDNLRNFPPDWPVLAVDAQDVLGELTSFWDAFQESENGCDIVQ